MRKLLWGIFLVLLLIISSVPVMAQDVSDEAVVRVIPDEAEVGRQHIILITGLEANEEVTVRIVSEDNGNAVYETEQTADDRGILEVVIYTDSQDIPGAYTVEVVNSNDDVIGTAELSILESQTFEPVVSVDPLEAERGSVFTIEISNVRPFARLELIIENEAGEEVFTQSIRATVDGVAVIEFVSDETTTGRLSVTVIENESTRIAAFEITVLDPALTATIEIEPAEALPGDTIFVSISGLEPETPVVAEIVFADTVIDTIEDSANVSGLMIFPYTFAADSERGAYQIRVFQNDEQIGLQSFSVDIAPVTVAIAPPIGTVGTVFVVTVNDLRADEEITVEFSLDGELVQTRTASANAEGIARTTLGQRVDLVLGVYDVRVLRFGEEVFAGTVEVAEERPPSPIVINPEDVTVTVSPESGTIPTAYTITVEGVPADTDLDLSIIFDGQSIFSFSGTTDADGFYTTLINSEASDTPGIYTLEVTALGAVIGTADFEIADESSETDTDTDDEGEDETDTAPVVEGDVSINISPAVLRQGERIEFIVTNLAPEESITFELLFEGDLIYSTESTANADGAAGIALRAEEDETIGEYEVRVLRDGEIIANNSFEIVDADAQVSNAQLNVAPESGQQGTDYAIIVTGLEAGETVEVVVSFDGEITYETEREANAEGTFTVVLNSDASDDVGDYTVTLIRENGSELEASFTITEADTEVSVPEDDEDDEVVASEVSISISPDEGEIGTNHEISVSGLNANEDFTFIIAFDGDEVYSVARTADDDGNFSTTITASEGDPIGEYEIIIAREDGDDVVAQLLVVGDEEEADVEVEEQHDSELELSIEPDQVELLETFDVLIKGLEADETVNIEVEYDGEIIFQTEQTANDDGEITLPLSTDESDPIGTYTIIVQRGDEEVSATLEVIGADEPEPEVSAGDIEIAVDPSSGAVGTEYAFIISGLGSNTEFDIMVQFDGETVYETSRISDASGFYTIRLETGEDDASGVYTFVVVQDGEELASINFEVESALASGEDDTEETTEASIDTDDDEQLPPAVAYTADVSIEFDADTSLQIIEFDGVAGDVIAITVDSGDSVDTVATLISPSGEEIATDDDGGLGFDPEIERAVLPDSGIYTLEVRTFTPGDEGTATVTINRNDVRTLDDNETRVVTLNSKITTDILTFEGQAGEIISLVIELDSGGIGALVITAEQNDTLLMNYQTFGLPQTVVLGFVVPEDGNVVIRIEDNGTASATLNASIERE